MVGRRTTDRGSLSLGQLLLIGVVLVVGAVLLAAIYFVVAFGLVFGTEGYLPLPQFVGGL